MTDNHLLEFGLLCLTSLFTMINPLSITPIFTSMTAGLPREQSRNVARRATITAAAILIIFAVTGSAIFEVFGISTNSLKIVGGVLFFLMGYEMVQAKLNRTQFDNSQNLQAIDEYTNDVAITPIAIPLICGPGAIATVIILMNQAKGHAEEAVLLSVILSVCTITYLFLRFAKKIMARLGDSGNKVLMRIMGLIVMVIAVEYFVGGMKPILRDIFMIQAG
ncbi:MarC family protein [Endozoicomonadaceae bacterium StTr2]